MSNAERHELAKRLFDRACELPGSERAAFLDHECGDDVALRAELDALLAADEEESPGPLQRGGGLQVLAEHLGSSPESTGTPGAIDQYRIVREIGRGGMGIVYEAEQRHPRRRVALKVMRTVFAGSDLLKRFRHEAQLLGQLDHPGIAKIHEAGTATIQGETWPFFAMEYVEGLPIDEHVRGGTPMSTSDVLELMARVCDAVHHAHQKGIVHRDLKPANILVRAGDPAASGTGSGTTEALDQPKVLDFGVARALDPELDVTTIRTHAGQIVGTVAYMSPEQLEGRPDVDTRCDVWALGVILYELLAGRHPFDLSGKPMAEAARVIRDADATPLGARSPKLRGDVEAIVAKAMEKDPDRRYVSAAELGDDLRRSLRSEPISARPATAIDQLQKFARRNRALVGGVLATTAALTIGLIATTAALLNARAERDAKTEALGVSDAVTTFLAEMLAAPRPEEQGREVTVREVLDGAAGEVGERFPDLPLVEAKLRSVIGESYLALGEYATADSQVVAAMALWAGQGRGGTEDALRARLLHGELRYYAGDYEGAAAAFAAAVEGFHGQEDPDQELLAGAQGNLAFVHMQRGDFARARELFDATAAMVHERYGPDHEIAIELDGNRAMLDLRTGRDAEAEAGYRDVIERSKRVRGPDHRETVLLISNLGTLYLNQSRYEEAIPLVREALRAQEEALGPAHSQTLITLNNLAQALAETGDFDEGLALVEEGLARSRAAYGERNPSTIYLATGLGRVLRRGGRTDRARDVVAGNVATAREVLGDDTDATYAAWRDLTGLLLARGEHAEAAAESHEMAEAMSEVFGEAHERTRYARVTAAQAYRALGDCERAARELEIAIAAADSSTLAGELAAHREACRGAGER